MGRSLELVRVANGYAAASLCWRCWYISIYLSS